MDSKKEIMAEARRALNSDDNRFIGITALPDGHTVIKSTEDNNMTYAILVCQLMDCEVKRQGLESIIDANDLGYEVIATGISNVIQNELFKEVLNRYAKNSNAKSF